MSARSLLAPSDSAVRVSPTFLHIPVEGTGRNPPDEVDDEAREEHREALTDCDLETSSINRWLYWANGDAQGSVLNAPDLSF